MHYVYISCALTVVAVLLALVFSARCPNDVSADYTHAYADDTSYAYGSAWYALPPWEAAEYTAARNAIASDPTRYNRFTVRTKLGTSACIPVDRSELPSGMLFGGRYNLTDLEMNMRAMLINGSSGICAVHFNTLPVCACMLRVFNRPFEMFFNMNLTGFELGREVRVERSIFCPDTGDIWVRRWTGMWVEWHAQHGQAYTRFYTNATASRLAHAWENNHGITICDLDRVDKLLEALKTAHEIPQVILGSIAESIRTESASRQYAGSAPAAQTIFELPAR